MVSAPPPQRPVGFRPSEISDLVNEEVVALHAEESSFLWHSRDQAVRAPHYSLKDLVALDDRVEAHLDGLRAAREAGWQAARSVLESGDPGGVFAATVLCFTSGYTGCRDHVRDVALADSTLERALVSGLAWLSFPTSEAAIREFLASDRANERRVGVAACAVQRADPGAPLVRALADSDAGLRARALRAAGELGKTDLVAAVFRGLSDENADCRFFAAWSAARLGARDSTVLKELWTHVSGSDYRTVVALDMLVRCVPPGQAKRFLEHVRSHGDPRLAIIGAGILGDPELVPWLIQAMYSRETARVAGEAFAMITGVDLRYDDLDSDEPAGGPNTSPDEEPVPDGWAAMYEADLPWPDPKLVADWWAEHGQGFQRFTRFIRGRQMTTESLFEALVHGYQRQRWTAALELAVRTPSQPLFPVRGEGRAQLARLGRWSS